MTVKQIKILYKGKLLRKMPCGQAALTSCILKALLLCCITHNLENNQPFLPAASPRPPAPTGSKRQKGSGPVLTQHVPALSSSWPHPTPQLRSSFLLKWGRGDSKGKGARRKRRDVWPEACPDLTGSAGEHSLPTRDSGGGDSPSRRPPGCSLGRPRREEV